MSQRDEWSPDEPLDTEAFEQGDEAFDEGVRLDPELLEDLERDPSLDPTLRLDERELEEAGVELDDPEEMSTLHGDIDDPDGLGQPSSRARARRDDQEGWDLDAPAVGPDTTDAGAGE